jgi:eukaryotic-like serine/threonine-protein kinase
MSEPTESPATADTTTTRVSGVPAVAGTSPATPAPDHPLRIGEFVILGKLGEGAFGQVFLARQISLGREVALKVNHPGEGGSDVGIGSVPEPGSTPSSSRNEGQLLASLEHDHIVKVFSEFKDAASGRHGLCLQYVPGADLGTVIRRIHGGDRPPESGNAILAALDATRRGEIGFDPAALRDREALAVDDFAQAVCRIGARLAEALAFAHARGVLHCDIKPANILVTPYGRPMLADFNVAFDRTRHQACGGGIGGTITYMAPEHRAAVMGLPAGRVDERCDVFSLGVVLHELATGQRPLPPRLPGAVVNPKAKPSEPPLDRVPRELAVVIRRCLETEPARRYQTAGELATALGGAQQLLAARRALAEPGAIGRWVTANPVWAMGIAGVIPHIIASVVNIAYNAVQIHLDDAQQRVFVWLIVVYDSLAYLICFGTACLLLWRINQRYAKLPRADGPDIDELRRRVRVFGWWAIGCGVAGWLPGSLLFPLVIGMATSPLPGETFGHYIVSFTLGGLIGVVFSFLAVEYVVFRAMLPRLGNPDTYTPASMWAEIRPLTAPFGVFMLLACAIPMVGAVLLLVLGSGEMSLGFRLLVAGLIGMGVAGVGIAERLTRKLRTLAAIWHRDPSAR